MASVNRAATKRPKDRRPSDVIRLKAGEMLTYDNLSALTNVAERHAMKNAAAASVTRNQNCLQLPLTIAYFTFYTWAMYLHEDITAVWLLESTMRMHTDRIFRDLVTVESLWDSLISADPETGMVGVFFQQTDFNGQPINKTATPQDKWGMWGRVDTFNQIQGAVRLQQSRRVKDFYGQVMPCNSNITCALCRTGAGFWTMGDLKVKGRWGQPNMTLGPCPGRRLLAKDSEESHADMQTSEAMGEMEPGARRLTQVWNPMLTSLPPGARSDDDGFRFYLYPGETQQQIQERLMYFKDRGWLDKNSNQLQIRMYVLNAEWGRPRLEQLTVILSISDAGDLYYQRELQAIFLLLFAGNINLIADILFLVMLIVSTASRLVVLWKAFIASRFIQELTSLYTMLELIVAGLGWLNVWGVWNLNTVKTDVTDQLLQVRAFGWDLSSQQDDLLDDLFTTANNSVDQVAWLRTLFAYYSMCLMFRFFVSFDSEPRLAIVTHTLKLVVTDLIHLGVIFMPGFMAYVISGSLLFGRFHPDFATIQGSLGYCFWAGFTANYDWYVLNQYNYWTCAIWVWSFMLYINLLLLNILMAVILDVYDDIRLKNQMKEAVWDTLYNYLLRLRHFRFWVQERHVLAALSKASSTLITVSDLQQEFPKMPDQQKELLFFQANKIMTQEAMKGLDKVNNLKLLGSMMQHVSLVNSTLENINIKESDDPVSSWVTPVVTMREGANQDITMPEDSFLTQQVTTKGGMPAHFMEPALATEEAAREKKSKKPPPVWLKQVKDQMSAQRQWLDFADWNLKKLQYIVQSAHLAHAQEAEPAL